MIDQLVADIEKSVARGDPAGLGVMLARITSLFTDNADRLGEPQVATLDAVILPLARTVASGARADLSERIADYANAPPRVILDLAFDEDVSVAGPVLTRSPRMDDEVLTRIARARGQDHILAISRRRTLAERVTDVLVVRGDHDVARALADNRGARLSIGGYGVMTERARADSDLRATLAARGDLPPARRGASAMRPPLAEEPAPARQPVSQTPERPSPVAPPRSEAERAFQDAIDRVGVVAAVELVEARVVAWLNGGQVLDAVAALARIADVPPRMALDAHEASDHDPILFLLRAIRFGWGTLKLFILAKPGKGESPEELRGAFEAFQALSVPTAQRVVRFTATRDQAKKGAA